eukprot:jgi/Botrbrau1/396/Bobra.110_2s0050.2
MWDIRKTLIVLLVQEDDEIIRLVGVHGARQWSRIAAELPGRIGKQCRERWHNHLDPSIKHSEWTAEEDEILIERHNEFGNSWALLATYLPGRTDNNIKNRWNSTLKRRVEAGLAEDGSLNYRLTTSRRASCQAYHEQEDPPPSPKVNQLWKPLPRRGGLTMPPRLVASPRSPAERNLLSHDSGGSHQYDLPVFGYGTPEPLPSLSSDAVSNVPVASGRKSARKPSRVERAPMSASPTKVPSLCVTSPRNPQNSSKRRSGISGGKRPRRELLPGPTKTGSGSKSLRKASNAAQSPVCVIAVSRGVSGSRPHLFSDLPSCMTDARVRVTFESPQADKPLANEETSTTEALGGYELSMSTPMKDGDDDEKSLRREPCAATPQLLYAHSSGHHLDSNGRNCGIGCSPLDGRGCGMQISPLEGHPAHLHSLSSPLLASTGGPYLLR